MTSSADPEPVYQCIALVAKHGEERPTTEECSAVATAALRELAQHDADVTLAYENLVAGRGPRIATRRFD